MPNCLFFILIFQLVEKAEASIIGMEGLIIHCLTLIRIFFLRFVPLRRSSNDLLSGIWRLYEKLLRSNPVLLPPLSFNIGKFSDSATSNLKIVSDMAISKWNYFENSNWLFNNHRCEIDSPVSKSNQGVFNFKIFDVKGVHKLCQLCKRYESDAGSCPMN